MMPWCDAWLSGGKPRNVWIGTSVEDQTRADERIPLLLSIPAKVRFLSCEPLLGPVDLRLMERSYGFPEHITRVGHAVGMPQGIHWVICGGESGPGARPMQPNWARSLRDECSAAVVPFHYKQWGEWAPHTPTHNGDLGGDLRRGTVVNVRPSESDEIRMPGCVYMKRVGKKAAGRLLDGRTHDEFPLTAEQSATI